MNIRLMSRYTGEPIAKSTCKANDRRKQVIFLFYEITQKLTICLLP